MTERHIAPVLCAQLGRSHHRPAVLGAALVVGHDSLHVAMDHQHLVAARAGGTECWTIRPHQGLVGHGEDREVKRWVIESALGGGGHVHPQFFEQPEDGARLHRARGVVVPGDQNDRSPRQRGTQPLELLEREDNGGIGRPHAVKEVPSHHHGVGPGHQDAIHR